MNTIKYLISFDTCWSTACNWKHVSIYLRPMWKHHTTSCTTTSRFSLELTFHCQRPSCLLQTCCRNRAFSGKYIWSNTIDGHILAYSSLLVLSSSVYEKYIQHATSQYCKYDQKYVGSNFCPLTFCFLPSSLRFFKIQTLHDFCQECLTNPGKRASRVITQVHHLQMLPRLSAVC